MNRSSRSADQLFLVLLTEQGRGVSSCPDSLTNMDYRVRAALDQSGLPAFLPLSGKLARPAHVRESIQAGTCPRKDQR